MRPAAGWIARLQLRPHPEGGYYRRVHTDPQTLQTPAGVRPVATSIHYLLDRDSPLGRLHRNRSRILHYLQHGGPVDYWLLDPGGTLSRHTLGYAAGQLLFLNVPGGTWKASVLGPAVDHALVSEVVLPGFDFADHEFMRLDQLRRDYPQHLALLAPLVTAG